MAVSVKNEDPIWSFLFPSGCVQANLHIHRPFVDFRTAQDDKTLTIQSLFHIHSFNNTKMSILFDDTTPTAIEDTPSHILLYLREQCMSEKEVKI